MTRANDLVMKLTENTANDLNRGRAGFQFALHTRCNGDNAEQEIQGIVPSSSGLP